MIRENRKLAEAMLDDFRVIQLQLRAESLVSDSAQFSAKFNEMSLYLENPVLKASLDLHEKACHDLAEIQMSISEKNLGRMDVSVVDEGTSAHRFSDRGFLL